MNSLSFNLHLYQFEANPRLSISVLLTGCMSEPTVWFIFLTPTSIKSSPQVNLQGLIHDVLLFICATEFSAFVAVVVVESLSCGSVREATIRFSSSGGFIITQRVAAT